MGHVTCAGGSPKSQAALRAPGRAKTRVALNTGRSGAQEIRLSGKKRACVSRDVIPSDIAFVVVVPWEERR